MHFPCMIPEFILAFHGGVKIRLGKIFVGNVLQVVVFLNKNALLVLIV